MYNVAVVGAGVIGLTTAVEIQKQYGSSTRVTIFSEKLSPNTTGDVSAGLWQPYLMQNTPDAKINKWSKLTAKLFEELWRNGFAEEAGISLIPVAEFSKEPWPTPSWSRIPYGFQKLSKTQLEAYNQQHGENYVDGITSITFTCEPKKFLPFLLKRFLVNGGQLKKIKITDLEALDGYDCIVNCSGLNSRELAQDESVQPIRGQITRVEAPWLNFCFMNDYNYIIPNSDSVILGGTKQLGDYNLEVDVSDKMHILSGCNKIVPGLKNAPIIKHMVGLRPGRPAVRLELTSKQSGGKPLKIIHNYGHGGCGVTLCAGCAVEAAELVGNVLNTSKSKL